MSLPGNTSTGTVAALLPGSTRRGDHFCRPNGFFLPAYSVAPPASHGYAGNLTAGRIPSGLTTRRPFSR